MKTNTKTGILVHYTAILRHITIFFLPISKLIKPVIIHI